MVIVMGQRAMIPLRDLEDMKRITGKLGKFPLYGLLLYSVTDTDFAEFISKSGGTLHHMTGSDCLLMAFENPAPWGTRYQEYWKKVLGDEYQAVSEKWKEILPEDRDLGYEVAAMLGISPNHLPCIVFVNDLLSKKALCVPVIASKEDYIRYFKDLATIIQESVKKKEADPLEELKKRWRPLWLKWVLPEKVKGYTKTIQEWGSMLTDTKNSIVSVFDLISPILKKIIPIPSE